MILPFITLLTSLVISSVAIYYSVTGLAAIFAASAIPIIIMGMSLELGKLVTAVWLHKNWKNSPKILRAYFMIATLVLMLITSMGIFGFLSKAHIEQTASVGDISAQIEVIDSKIQAKKEEISTAQTTIKGMDEVVNQYLQKGTDVKSVTNANNTRKQNSKERIKLQNQIDQAQKEIFKLNEEKFPLNQKIRKAEAEVGPIKYIAQFVYGSNANKDLFDRAVTWMIFTIIFVFDPLAVLLLIASQIGFEQASVQRQKSKLEKEQINKTKKDEELKKVEERKLEEEKKRLEQEVIIQLKIQEAEIEAKRFEAESEMHRLKIAAEEAERKRIEELTSLQLLEQEIKSVKEVKRPTSRIKKKVKEEPVNVNDIVIEESMPDFDTWNKILEEAEKADPNEKILKETKPLKKKETFLVKNRVRGMRTGR